MDTRIDQSPYTIVRGKRGNYLVAEGNRGGFRAPRWIWIALGAVVVSLFALTGTGYGYRALRVVPPSLTHEIPGDKPAMQKLGKDLTKKRTELDKALAATTPKGTYIVVDQTQNRLYLKKGEETMLTAVCSAGSGMVLQEGKGGKGRRWVFDTPRGVRKVLRRVTNPVWKKPDWAFIEDGQAPPRNDSERFEYGDLGKYALHLGDGYMIHGTLWKNTLGRSVSHGCIRLGDDDLQKVWDNTTIGTPVYIY